MIPRKSSGGKPVVVLVPASVRLAEAAEHMAAAIRILEGMPEVSIGVPAGKLGERLAEGGGYRAGWAAEELRLGVAGPMLLAIAEREHPSTGLRAFGVVSHVA